MQAIYYILNKLVGNWGKTVLFQHMLYHVNYQLTVKTFQNNQALSPNADKKYLICISNSLFDFFFFY